MTDSTELEHARTPKPSFLKGLVFLLVIAVIVALLAAFVLTQRSEEGPLVPTAAPVPISVDVVEVSLSDTLSLEERFTGLVSPRRTSALGFQSGGRIVALRADIGDRVRTGAVLARLDTRALEAQLAAAEATVVEAEAAYALAQATVERQKTLNERGHVSQQRVDEAIAQANTSLARIDAARASADTLQVQIDLARIVAPYAGVITARMADEGAIAAPGQPVFELVENGVLEARIGLPAELSQTLTIGETYLLIADQGEVSATLRAVTGVIDANQRTVTTIFDINNIDEVASGAVVRITLSRDVTEQGLWVPVSALAESQRGLWSVYLARSEGETIRAQKSVVEIVHSEGDRAYVRGAIRNGDLVIIDGLQRITPGQAVTPVEVAGIFEAPKTAALEQ
ncbi:efflux RND transporter periplasmic adaptor subunit [Hyphomonas sp. FCG-A18]|uniref:efflux RND transporter periplasmic adaptor subunit n=1 Tax=Hyphomonas sp. FCG-A18 TaxID=3080019 RepID=UPI002B27C94C|nr:efflux RND transporter periplasmic adaptor subunit [Hyphomonas sp. FCG-A18]